MNAYNVSDFARHHQIIDSSTSNLKEEKNICNNKFGIC